MGGEAITAVVSTPSTDKELFYSSYRVGGVEPSPDDSGREAAALFARTYLLDELERKKAEPVLELGAGCGWTLVALRNAGFVNCRGVDISPSQLAIARSCGIAVEELDALAALRNAERGSLGAVIALDLLEHLPSAELVECVRLVASRLQPDGVFVLRVPNGAGLFGGVVRYGDLTHEQAFTDSSLRQLLATAGLDKVRTRPCRPLVHGAMSATRYVLWRAVEAAISFANAAESGQWRGGIFTRNLIASARR